MKAARTGGGYGFRAIQRERQPIEGIHCNLTSWSAVSPSGLANGHSCEAFHLVAGAYRNRPECSRRTFFSTLVLRSGCASARRVSRRSWVGDGTSNATQAPIVDEDLARSFVEIAISPTTFPEMIDSEQLVKWQWCAKNRAAQRAARLANRISVSATPAPS